MNGKRLSTKTVGELRDHRYFVARIIQEHFFPYPPTRLDTMSPAQREEFLECADEIMEDLRFHGWQP